MGLVARKGLYAFYSKNLCFRFPFVRRKKTRVSKIFIKLPNISVQFLVCCGSFTKKYCLHLV